MNKLHQAVNSAKGVVFDLFHTLTAKESQWSPGPMTYAMLGVDREEWQKQLFETSRSRLIGEERDPRKIIEKMARAINPAITDEIILLAVANRLDRFTRSLINVPPANVRLLARLRRQGCQLGLVSNADASEVQGWNRSPLAEHFHSTVFSCEVGFAKPEPEIFHHCLNELQLKPSDCVYVADGGFNELTAARSLGFTTVMVAGVIRELWPEKIPTRAGEAHFMIEEPTELLPLEE